MAGMGLVQVVRGLNTGFGAVSTSEDHSEAFNPLGATVMLDDGRGFRYLKINQIGAVGQIVTPLLSIDDADVDAASSDATLTGTDDFILNEFADGSAFVFINAGTGLGQVRRIRSNTANVLTVDSAWSTALDTTSDYVTFAPYEVELCDATFERVVGVELSAHTADYYGWFQISGLALVRCAGGTDALVAHEGLVSSSAEGVAKGLTSTPTAEEADRSFGYAVMAYSAADAAGQVIPIMLNRIL